MEQRKAARVAEAEGKRAAEARAAVRAADTGPVNHFAERAAELAEQVGYKPHLKHKLAVMQDAARKWQAERDAEQAEAERQQKIASDPGVVNALENCEFTMRAAGPDDQAELIEIRELARAGDVAGYWQRIRNFEQRQWTREDQLAASAAASRTASNAAFLEQAAKAEAAKERLDYATTHADSPADAS